MFTSPNFTQAPNDFFDKLLREIDDLSELKVTLVAIRQTFGFHRTLAKMSQSFIETATGLSRNSVRRGIELAVKRGTLVEVQGATNTTPTVYEVPVSADPRSTVEGQPMTDPGSAVDPQPLTPRNKEIEKKDLKKAAAAPAAEISHDEIPASILDSKGRRLAIFEFYEKTFNNVIPPMLYPELRRYGLKYPRDQLEAAFMRTAQAGARSWNYTKKILDDGLRDGPGNDRPPPPAPAHPTFLRLEAEDSETLGETLARLLDAGRIQQEMYDATCQKYTDFLKRPTHEVGRANGNGHAVGTG